MTEQTQTQDRSPGAHLDTTTGSGDASLRPLSFERFSTPSPGGEGRGEGELPPSLRTCVTTPSPGGEGRGEGELPVVLRCSRRPGAWPFALPYQRRLAKISGSKVGVPQLRLAQISGS